MLNKVLLTVSPFRPSFLQSLAVHPANDRFSTPLFSASSESLFSQLLSFHNYLRCPIVFSAPSFHPLITYPRRTFPSSNSLPDILLRTLVVPKNLISFVIKQIQTLSSKYPGWRASRAHLINDLAQRGWESGYIAGRVVNGWDYLDGRADDDED